MLLFGKPQKRCPRRPVLDHPDRFNYWMRTYREYQLGLWPDSEPGTNDQAAMVVTVMRMMDGIYATIRAQQDEDRKNNRGRKGRSAA